MAQIEKETSKMGFLKGIEHVFLKMSLTGRKKEIKAQSKNEQLVENTVQKNGESIEDFIERNNKLQAQQKQADNFLNAQLPHLYFAMIDNGYQPTTKQAELINNKVNSLIKDLDRGNGFEGINKFIKLGYKLSPDNVYHIISSHFFQKHFFNDAFFNSEVQLDSLTENLNQSSSQAITLASIDNNTKSTVEKYSNLYSDFMINIRETLFSEEGSNFIANKWMSILKNQDGDLKVSNYDYEYDDEESDYYSFKINELVNIPAFIKYMPHLIMPHIKIEKYLEIMTQWQEQKAAIGTIFESEYYEHSSFIDLYTKYAGIKEDKNSQRNRRHSGDIRIQLKNFYFKETENLLNATLENYFSNDIKGLLDTTKATYANTYLEEKAIKTTQVLSHNYKVSSLPKTTQDTIQEIQSVYTALQAHKATFSDEQKFLVDNLFDKRIPEVLQKYFSIDKDYRSSMKNSEGKNAQDLMDESLTNFKNKLTEVLDNINQAKLSDLSVTKRYSKSI